jgi:subtilisin family serine protease
VLVAKAMGADGQGAGTALLAAAEWMADPDGNPATADFPAAVNNSWTGGDANDPWFRSTMRVWLALGIVPVFAAGNSGPAGGSIGSPASYPEALSVAAVDDLGVLAGFSSRGPVLWENRDGTGPVPGTSLLKADVAAPGVAIVSSVGSGYQTYSGTSMAAPHVAGVVGLLKAAVPALGAAQIADLIRRTARDGGPAGPDAGYGTGVVDALSAVAGVLGAPPAAAAPPLPAPIASPRQQAGPTAVSPLRGVRVSAVARRNGTLVVTGRLTRSARVRATLAGAGGAGTTRALGAAVSRPAGSFRLALRLRGTGVGPHRISIQATTAAGRALGPPVRRTVRITR